MEFNFSSLKGPAMEMAATLEAGGTPAAPASTPAPAAASAPAPSPAVGAPVTPSPAAPASTPAAPASAPAEPAVPAAASSPDAPIEVRMPDGSVQKLTPAQILDLQQNGLRQSDYTRKTQEVAAQRAEAQRVYEALVAKQAEYEHAQALLNNPAAMKAEAERRLAEQMPIDPNQPLTMAHAQALTTRIASAIQQVQAEAAAAIEKAQTEAKQFVEDSINTAKYGESINTTLNKLKTENPILAAIPEMEDIIRFRVGKLEPVSIDETLKAFQTVGAQVARELTAQVEARIAQTVATKQVLQATATEPAGGAAPQPTQPSYFKDGKLDWKGLKEQARSIVG